MRIYDVEQRSPEWHALRLGRLCGSRASEMLATIKSGGEAAVRRNLRVQLVLERLTGKSHERQFQSQAMLDGIEREADAFAAYECLSGRVLRTVGYISHDELGAGFSPDGIVGDFDASVEAKSPIPSTHLEFIRTGVVPGEYAKQILHGFWIAPSLQWCDYVSWQPDFPPSLQIKVVRVDRDAQAVEDYDRKARTFLAEVERELETLLTLGDLRGTLAASAVA